MTTAVLVRPNRLRRRAYEILEIGRGDDRASTIVDAVLIVLVVVNVIAFTLETVDSIKAEYGALLDALEIASVAIFTAEYLARLWTAVEVPFLARMPASRARFRFAIRPYMLIDLLAIVPFYLSVLFPADLRVLRVLRLFRFLKLARYSPAMHTLVRVLVNERRSLLGALLLVLGALLFASTGIYLLERHAQPDKFGSIPESAWWAMATLSTVGYGDIVPITPLGKIFGVVVMITGLCMFALPIAIISTGFAQEVSRRDFVVTWSLMSRIPLFAELDATHVAELMGYVAAHTYPPHWEVIHAGTPGTAMYFISSGRIRVVGPTTEAELGTGDFFGEVALLEGGNYEVSFRTASHCRLLKINREDFDRLAAANPAIADHIRRVAEARKRARSEGRAEPEGTIEPNRSP